MRRVSFLGIVVASAVLSTQLGAQAVPDCSGTWVLTSTGIWPSDQRLTIAQNPTTFTVDGIGYSIHASTNGTRTASTQTQYSTRTTYVVDGSEHPYSVTFDPPPQFLPATASLVMSSRTEDAVYKASWVGRRLVVVRYENEKITRPKQTPDVVVLRRMVRDTIELASDGTLVWETLTLADPMPWSDQAPTPTPFRRIFKRSAP